MLWPIKLDSIGGSHSKLLPHLQHHSERVHLAVTNLGQQTVIIRHSWLTLHNPEVDWATQKVSMM